MTTFLLYYGLVPLFGGDQVGLVGADEPRYRPDRPGCCARTTDAAS